VKYEPADSADHLDVHALGPVHLLHFLPELALWLALLDPSLLKKKTYDP
jgi:hypothetical protein